MSENQLPLQVRIRPATESDANFIFNSWLKCYRHSINTRGCENPVFFTNQHKVIEGLVKTATVLIACNDLDVSQIYGYSVAEHIEGSLVVHFTYVKEPMRRFGIASSLLKAMQWDGKSPMFYTHRTGTNEKLDLKILLVYNPYLAHYAFAASNE